jgi:hypothetical protein
MGCAALVGKPFVDMELVAEDGSACKLSDFVGKGKPVVIDFTLRGKQTPSASLRARTTEPPARCHIRGEFTLPF